MHGVLLILLLLRHHLLLDGVVQGPLAWPHLRDALLFLHPLLIVQVLEVGHLLRERVNLLDRTLLELVKHLDLRVERLRNGNVSIKLLAFRFELI